MTDIDTLLIDPARWVCLCDMGAPGYRAVVTVDADGIEHLLLADEDRINDATALVDTRCAAAEHEKPGPLPLEFTRRIAISQRTHRCGRPTAAGGRCRIQVSRPGQPCGLHR